MKHHPPKPFPREQWRATGTAATGEVMDFEGFDRAEVEYAADRINRRGGAVVVRREVYDGPGARYAPVGP